MQLLSFPQRLIVSLPLLVFQRFLTLMPLLRLGTLWLKLLLLLWDIFLWGREEMQQPHNLFNHFLPLTGAFGDFARLAIPHRLL